jgi:ADP-ribosylglycohydrolase
MGGPVESSHYKRIREVCGKITGLIPYNEHYMLKERVERKGGSFYPGYALHPDPGSITDDTFCRKDMCRFYIETNPPRTPEVLADWLLKNAELETQWSKLRARPLHLIAEGKANATDFGDTHRQGGGLGWWSPIGIIYAGEPLKAAAEFRKMSVIWKASLERDLGAAAVASVAEGCKENATWETQLQAMLDQCGPLALVLCERAIRIANNAKDVWDMAEQLYDQILMPETRMNTDEIFPLPDDPPLLADAPLPKRHSPIDYIDSRYTSFFWAEQVPLAVAAFVFAKGSIDAIPTCVNLGRDCDTTATTVGAWVGALQGISRLPREWVESVYKVNMKEMDIMGLAEKLLAVKV